MTIIRDDEVLPRVRRQPGVYLSPELTLPVEATYAMLIADSRSTWDQRGAREIVLSATLEGFVGGAWVVLGGFTTDASPKLRRDGTPLDASSIRVRLPRTRQGSVPVRAVLQCASPCAGAVRLIMDDTPPPVRPTQQHQSVTYDNDNEAVANAVTSVTIGSFAIGNNANRCLMLGIVVDDATAGDTVVSSISHNSSTAGWASVISQAHPSGGGSKSQIWRKVAPSVVSATVILTMVGTCSDLAAHALSVYDVDQTTPIGTAVSTTGGPGTLTSTTVNVAAVTGDMVYDAVYLYGESGTPTTATVGASQTDRCNSLIHLYAPNGRLFILASTEPGATTTTMSWTIANSGSAAWIVQCACPIKMAAAAAGHPAIRRFGSIGYGPRRASRNMRGVH